MEPVRARILSEDELVAPEVVVEAAATPFGWSGSFVCDGPELQPGQTYRMETESDLVGDFRILSVNNLDDHHTQYGAFGLEPLHSLR